MFLKVFRGTGPKVIFLITITFGLLWISAFLNPQSPGSFIYETRPMPLYGIVKFLLGGNPLPGVIFSFLLMSLMLFLIAHFNTTVFFINERTYLPVLFYILFGAIFPQNQSLNPALPAALFLMLVVMRIMDAYRKPGTAFNFFDAGILISIGSLFYADLVWFGLLLVAGIALLRTGNIKEIALSFLGLSVPYLLVIGFLYVLGKDIGAFMTDIKENLFGNSSGYFFPRLTVIFLIYSALILFVSIGYLMTQMSSKKIKSRKTFFLLLWVFAISLALYFFLPSVTVEMIWITGMPASYFLAHYFVFVKKKILPEIFFAVFYLLVLLIQVLYIF